MREECERDKRPGRSVSTEGRNMAIADLAWIFHRHASKSISDHYRIALVDFVAAGLKAVGFKVPEGRTKNDTTEGREILRYVPEEFWAPREVIKPEM
jgi:hypothetical protein